jgi:asparagine synthase (glutamine-hydrolysing)
MLHATPESLAENQPLVSSDGSLVLVFDGRLDNRGELANSLYQHGLELDTSSDADMVLGAYELWSKNCPAKLLGDFSFAIWDARREQLFCARDHVGARQLYYVQTDRFFAFASDEEALLCLPGFSSRPYDELIAHYLVPDFKDFEVGQTWLKDVRALLPAHSFYVSPTGASCPESYWQFEFGEERQYASDQETKEAFLEVFGSAVRSRLRLVGEPAAMVSGGMDSGAIAAMLGRFSSKLPGGRYHSYSALADKLDSSLESRCIKSMTEAAHVAAHSVNVPSFSGMIGVDDLIETAWSKAHPVDNSILLPAMMSLAASRNGHHTLLHGVCGDLTMGNFPRYIAPLLREHQWRVAWHECKAAAQNHTYLAGNTPLQLLLRNSWTACVPLSARRHLSRLRKVTNWSSPDLSILNPVFVRKLGILERIKAQASFDCVKQGPEFRHGHVAGIFGPSGVFSGLSGYQRVASRYGVEMRDPWADKRVIEFFLHLPLQYSVRSGWTKYLARSTFAPDLGTSVVWRCDSEHLGFLFVQRLMAECSELVKNSINDEMVVLEQFVDIGKIRKIYAQYESSHDLAKMVFLFEILTLIHWVKRINV